MRLTLWMVFLYHDSDLRIQERYTDTAGFTNYVFALCHFLGFRFAPQIRDPADKRLYVPGKPDQWACARAFDRRFGQSQINRATGER
jgi:TnpA family transposase